MKLTPLLSLSLLALLAFSPAGFAQLPAGTAAELCAKSKIKARQAAARLTVGDPGEEAYDVHYVKLDLNVPNTGATISGVATTLAQVSASAGMSAYIFELQSGMTVDSVRVNGTLLPVVTTPGLRRVVLPAKLPLGSYFTAEVRYHGFVYNPLGGLRSTNVPGTINDHATYTLSESLEARDWWPCKQSLTDKIDSSDVWLTVPANCKGGSNGLLKGVTAMPNGGQRYEWQSRYPIDYYLLSLSVSPYTEYTYYTKFSPTDSMPVQNYLYTSFALTPALKATLDSTGAYIQYFSQLFGRYAFWKEKYGHCLAPLAGGMEHQTMTTLGYIEGFLFAHELAHQWWGDDVTCASWSDIWLNEGFASYSEYLYAAHFRSQTEADAHMRAWHNDVLSVPDGSVYVATDTLDESRLFSGRFTYGKGAAVLHSLRFEAGNDSTFFALLARYRQAHHFGAATTADLQQSAGQIYGRDMTAFFRQWIYGEGYPTISAEWNQTSDFVYLRLRQTSSMPSSVRLFSTPLEVRFASAAGDTTVRLQFSAAQQDYRFALHRKIGGLVIDPNNWIINRDGGAVRNSLLGPADGSETLIQVSPNPSRGSWQLRGVPIGASVRLFDLAGKLVRSYAPAAQPDFVLDGTALAAGTYLLKIEGGDGAPYSTKLTRE